MAEASVYVGLHHDHFLCSPPFFLIWDQAAGWKVFTTVNLNVCGSSFKDCRQHKGWICDVPQGFNEIGCFVLDLSFEKVGDVSSLRPAKCMFMQVYSSAWLQLKECESSCCLSFSEDKG